MPHLSVAKDRAGGPIQLYYNVSGSGSEKLVLINGMGGISTQWDDTVEFFTRKGFVVLVLDNRGSGRSSSPDVYYYTTEMALDLNELLDFLKWESIHVIGLSMGGMIAQELSWILKDKVRSLILESTYSRFPGLPWSAVKNIVLAKQVVDVQDFLSRLLPLLFPKEWLNAPCDPKRGSFRNNWDLAHDFFLKRYSEIGLQDSIGKFRQKVACISHYLSDKRLKEISQIPTLVLTGDCDDVLLQPVGSQVLARGLNAELKIYQGGGHAIRYQDPDWHNKHCLDHILRSIKNIKNS